MKVILYMTTTVNGFIAKQDDSSAFITPIESAQYVAAVTKAGALVVGHRTYDILSTQSEFQEFLKAGVKVVAVSHGDVALKDPSHQVAHSPQEALELLKDCEEVVVAGGGQMNAAFAKANLLDEIYIDIEPAVMGQGIPLFAGEDFDLNLKFLGSKMFSENEIQLHYQVLK